MLTEIQKQAVTKIPDCVDLDQVDEDDWSHFVFCVEHPVCLRSEGEDFYTKSEAKACQRWLKKYAPESEYSNVRFF